MLLKPEDAEKSPFGNVVTGAVGPQRNVMVDTLVFDISDLLATDEDRSPRPGLIILGALAEGSL